MVLCCALKLVFAQITMKEPRIDTAAINNTVPITVVNPDRFLLTGVRTLARVLKLGEYILIHRKPTS
jgi:hypothetical protein